LEDFVDIIKVNFSSFIPKVGNWFVFFFMGSSDVKLTKNFRFDLNLRKKVFITSFELIKPLNSVFMYHVKTIVSSFIFGLSIVSPFVCTGNIDQNPVVLKSPHSNISQNHRLSSSTISTQEDILERWCLIEKVGKIRWLGFYFNSLITFQLFESFGKVTSRWCDWHLHNFSDFSLNEFVRIFINQV